MKDVTTIYMKRGDISAQIEIVADESGSDECTDDVATEEDTEASSNTPDVCEELRSLDRRLCSLHDQVSRVMIVAICGIVLSGLAWSHVSYVAA